VAPSLCCTYNRAVQWWHCCIVPLPGAATAAVMAVVVVVVVVAGQVPSSPLDGSTKAGCADLG